MTTILTILALGLLVWEVWNLKKEIKYYNIDRKIDYKWFNLDINNLKEAIVRIDNYETDSAKCLLELRDRIEKLATKKKKRKK